MQRRITGDDGRTSIQTKHDIPLTTRRNARRLEMVSGTRARERTVGDRT